MPLEWVTAVGAGRVSCNCYSTGGPLSFWVLCNQCWWTLAVPYYIVIQLMEFSMSCISRLLQFWSLLVPAASKSYVSKQTSPFPQTKGHACSIARSLQIKNDTPTPWCMSRSSASASSETSLPWEPFSRQPLPMQPLQGVNAVSTFASQGCSATGLYYARQAALRGFQDWAPRELTKRFTGIGTGRMRLVRSVSPITWTAVAFRPWSFSVSEVHREAPRTGIALEAVAAVLPASCQPPNGHRSV